MQGISRKAGGSCSQGKYSLYSMIKDWKDPAETGVRCASLEGLFKPDMKGSACRQKEYTLLASQMKHCQELNSFTTQQDIQVTNAGSFQQGAGHECIRIKC